MKIAIAGPGIAVWRYKEHGHDLWEYGLISIQYVSSWRWVIGIQILDFDMAPGWHFDSYTTMTVFIGPLQIRLLYIDDLKN